MKKSTLLKKSILERRALVMPGAYDCISAKLIEQAGFEALQVSGFGLSASYLGKPDVGLLTFTEMVEFTKHIVDSVNIPVMGDADTGFGNALNARRTTEEFIKIGCAGMNIEDQVFPKRCGHFEGKRIIPIAEMVLKIRACKDIVNKLDRDFVINARTDAIGSPGGTIDEAIKRGNAYASAGADLIFVESPQSIAEIRRAVERIDAPVSINLYDAVKGGKTPLVEIEELKSIGVARVSIPVGPIFAAIKGVSNYLEAIKGGKLARDRYDLVCSLDYFKEFIGFSEYRELEEHFLPNLR